MTSLFLYRRRKDIRNDDWENRFSMKRHVLWHNKKTAKFDINQTVISILDLTYIYLFLPNLSYSFCPILIDKFVFSHILRKLVGVINFSKNFQKYPCNDPMSS